MANTDCRTAGFGNAVAEISEEQPAPFRAGRHTRQRTASFGWKMRRRRCLLAQDADTALHVRDASTTTWKSSLCYINSNHMTRLTSAILYLQTRSFQNRKHIQVWGPSSAAAAPPRPWLWRSVHPGSPPIFCGLFGFLMLHLPELPCALETNLFSVASFANTFFHPAVSFCLWSPLLCRSC